ncbi:hypothetical protein MPTA5024_32440 [Microbispora sp. ATCC PTA-5024]|nr:hypothetical protein MPTA5024_32440 [Microbispora sp. ATCC PTA-5024]
MIVTVIRPLASLWNTPSGANALVAPFWSTSASVGVENAESVTV